MREPLTWEKAVWQGGEASPEPTLAKHLLFSCPGVWVMKQEPVASTLPWLEDMQVRSLPWEDAVILTVVIIGSSHL